MPDFQSITYEVRDGIAEVAISRPDVLNAFNAQVIEELVEALDEAERSERVYSIVLTGEGRAFCAGVDTDEVLAPAGERDRLFNVVRLTKVRQVVDRLYNGTKPTIAAINGPAVGGGVSFALACDFRIMDENAYLRDQHANLGIPPGPAELWLLPRLIGESRAKEFVYTSRDITPDEAREWGLVIEVSEAGRAMDDALSLAADLRDKPALGMRGTKQLFDSNFASMEEASAASMERHIECLGDAEHREALAAVRDGREPDFERVY